MLTTKHFVSSCSEFYTPLLPVVAQIAIIEKVPETDRKFYDGKIKNIIFYILASGYLATVFRHSSHNTRPECSN
ncbi:hypothetical protein RCL_jg23785.t1 [Rhizophagus clarus]|uniref:Uncharacterized protein n=1 Tax=Rhizophagus clarus TaxID=94130 RepID=A0A8H3QUT0_9GLOM|nr:hypothetical protein RCL_jg23785.t1 [Rhizophagus clarus]